MAFQEELSFTLEDFEGPLDFLLYLVQKDEIDIYAIPLQELIKQFLQKIDLLPKKNIHQSAEFIGQTSFLLWLKSKTLLPGREKEESLPPQEDPRFTVIFELLDYYRFKEAANGLSLKEEESFRLFSRKVAPLEPVKGDPLKEVSLEGLQEIFAKILERSKETRKVIEEETYSVSDKIKWMKAYLKEHEELPFLLLFKEEMEKNELIVLFLATLEMLKEGFLKVVHSSKGYFLIKKNQGN